MPAIQLTQLRIEISNLVDCFGDPPLFVRTYQEFLSRYSDKAHRPGESGIPASLLPSYNVPRPVSRQVAAECCSLARVHQQAAWSLTSHLWEEAYLEFRILAVSVLGCIPIDDPTLLFERVQSWASRISDENLITMLVIEGLRGVRTTERDQFIQWAENWLSSQDILCQKLGLRSLIPLIEDPTFENIPLVYRWLNPFIRSSHRNIRADLVTILSALARRSPIETAFFLRQNIEFGGTPGAAWLARQTMQSYPADAQASLRRAMRSAGKNMV